jgi:hypothetical protein
VTYQIEKIIREIATIPNGIWKDASDPLRKPRRRGIARSATPVPGGFHIEAGNSEPADAEQWSETVDSVRRDITGTGGGREGSGLDALAWYRSFHGDPSAWGIYIPRSSLAIIDELYLSKLDMDRSDRLRVAADAILLHERFHFAVDLACAWFEILLRSPVRAESARRMESSSVMPGQVASQKWLEVEEAGANGHMLRSLATNCQPDTLEAIRNFVSTQPEGYRDGLNAIGDDEFQAVLTETIQSHLGVWALERGLDLGSPAFDPHSVIPISREALIEQCPVYEIDDLDESGLGAGNIKLILRIEAVQELPKFKKQLQKLDQRYQEQWERLKEQISIGLPHHPRFKKLKGKKPPQYALYLPSGHRVHLQPPDVFGGPWSALEVGTHTEMGHD